MEYDFSNKVVLVTGASAGMGEATAVLFARLGARVALVGRNEENLRAAAERCQRERGVQALPIVADLGTDEGCEKVAKDTLQHFGRLDILINNAAIGLLDTIENAKMETFDLLFKINVRGVYNLTRLLVPALIETKGNIVNISSIAGTAVAVGSVPYSMGKAALDHFSRLIALELAPKGVRVNTISPGLTISNFHVRMTGKPDDEFMDAAKHAIPMGSVCVADDIARAVVHLASDHSRLVTGTMLQVDGGLQYSSLNAILDNIPQ